MEDNLDKLNEYLEKITEEVKNLSVSLTLEEMMLATQQNTRNQHLNINFKNSLKPYP